MVLKFHRYIPWLDLFLTHCTSYTWWALSTWKFVFSVWEICLELFHGWFAPLILECLLSDVKSSVLFLLHSSFLIFLFIALAFGSIFWEITQTLFPRPSEFFIYAIMFVSQILKVYFCFLSSKVASYSFFIGVILSLILENVLTIFQVAFFCLLWFLVCVGFYYYYYLFSVSHVISFPQLSSNL